MVNMEVPRYWREMRTNTEFSGRVVGNLGVDPTYFKYPGGEIILSGSYEDIYSKFENKGFEPEVIEKILLNLFGSVASEASVSFEKIINSQSEFVGSEIGEKNRGEVKLGVNRLPRKISRKTLFAAGANY